MLLTNDLISCSLLILLTIASTLVIRNWSYQSDEIDLSWIRKRMDQDLLLPLSLLLVHLIRALWLNLTVGAATPGGGSVAELVDRAECFWTVVFIAPPEHQRPFPSRGCAWARAERPPSAISVRRRSVEGKRRGKVSQGWISGGEVDGSVLFGWEESSVYPITISLAGAGSSFKLVTGHKCCMSPKRKVTGHTRPSLGNKRRATNLACHLSQIETGLKATSLA